jgi:hypothetical protein
MDLFSGMAEKRTDSSTVVILEEGLERTYFWMCLI